jgi:hypothetical protein
MALATLSTRSPAARTGRARRIEPDADGTVLVLDDGGGVTVPGRPDPAGARRCRRALNHLVSVHIEAHADGCTAQLRGVGNRLPVTLAIAVPTALALVELGVPALVRCDQAGER